MVDAPAKVGGEEEENDAPPPMATAAAATAAATAAAAAATTTKVGAPKVPPSHKLYLKNCNGNEEAEAPRP